MRVDVRKICVKAVNFIDNILDKMCCYKKLLCNFRGSQAHIYLLQHYELQNDRRELLSVCSSILFTFR